MAAKSEEAFEELMRGGTFPQEDVVDYRIPEGETEARREVKVRRVQRFFRKAVLGSYENRCALTGISSPELLVASHIIPWSQDESRRADPTNGICLNALHDQAFDRHLITFDEDFRLVVSEKLKRANVSEFQKQSFEELEGVKLSLPHRFCPDDEALAKHRDAFVA